MTEDIAVNLDTIARLRALPVWQGELEWQVLKGGLSNESFLVRDRTGAYVARFGRDFPFHHVSREREIMATRAAVEGSFAPELIYAEPGIMVSRFIEGRTYAAEDVCDNAARVADLIRRYHNEMPHHVRGPGYIFWVFHVIRDYARTLEEGGSRMIPHLPGYLALADEMEAAQAPLPIIFGHHDLLPGNFVDDGERIWLIDFEYAGFGTPMFDLAGIASNAGFGDAETKELLARYFGRAPDRDIARSHAAMQCASLLREAMWSMVSELHLDVPGADYVAYTKENLDALAGVLDTYRTRFGKA